MTSGTLTWTIARWSDRATATYVDRNVMIDNQMTDDYGRLVKKSSEPRRMTHFDEQTNAIYLGYASGNEIGVIFKYS